MEVLFIQKGKGDYKVYFLNSPTQTHTLTQHNGNNEGFVFMASFVYLAGIRRREKRYDFVFFVLGEIF